MTSADSAGPVPRKDSHAEHPIAVAWRVPLRAIVHAFAHGDYRLSRGVPGVESPDERSAAAMRDYIADYGATLTDLDEATWDTSVASWQGGYWDVLVDLWTIEEGRSDLVLHCRVQEVDGGYRVEGLAVYVP